MPELLLIIKILRLLHLIFLSFGVGGATSVPIIMLGARSRKEPMAYVIKAVGSISKLIYAGLVGIILTGIGFSILGYPEKDLLLVKHILVAILYVTGNVLFILLPKMAKLSPKPKEKPSPQFLSTQKRIQALSITSLILWYAITVMSVFL